MRVRWLGLCSRKGQLNSIDFISAIVIFMVLVVFMVTFWFVSISHVATGVKENRMGAAAVSISDMLVKGSGTPSTWEDDPANAEVLGLAISPNVLSENKIQQFTSMDYNESREILGLDYDYYFYVECLEGNRLYESGTAGLGDQSIAVTRFAVLDDEKVRLRLVIHG